MRAKFIYEKFIEDSDPIKDLGIGVFSQRSFKSDKETADWIIQILPAILKRKKIPINIMSDPLHYMNIQIINKIRSYLAKYVISDGQKLDKYSHHDVFRYMRKKLIEMGYPYKDTEHNVLPDYIK